MNERALSLIAIPRRLVFFITARCNLSCVHCFLTAGPKKKTAELSKSRILGLFKSLDFPSEIVVTGGEPFLRKDLEAVLEGALGLASVARISVCSNGSFPDRIGDVCERLCSHHSKPLHLHLSLDGLAGTHDRIRHSINGFSKVMDLCERAKAIQNKYSHFSYCVSCVIMKDNIAEIDSLVSELEGRSIPSKLTLVRGNAFSTFGVPQELLDPDYNPTGDVRVAPRRLRQVIQKIDQEHPGYFSSFQKRKLYIMLKTLVSGKRQVNCQAGFREGVLFSNGDISICEQVKPFGNLAQWNWNLSRAWNSTEAARQRALLRQCSCIHGCNIMTSLRDKA